MSENLTSNSVASLEHPGHEFEKTEQKPYELIIKELNERFKASMKRLENMGQKTLNSGESLSPDDEPRIVRLEKEIEELKRDKLTKDAIIKELQQRISNLEASKNLAD
jgi:hypothetical protein